LKHFALKALNNTPVTLTWTVALCHITRGTPDCHWARVLVTSVLCQSLPVVAQWNIQKETEK